VLPLLIDGAPETADDPADFFAVAEQ